MLAYDDQRCAGEIANIQCKRRRSCARYLQLDVCGPRTPVTHMMSVIAVCNAGVLVANECDYFIEVTD